MKMKTSVPSSMGHSSTLHDNFYTSKAAFTVAETAAMLSLGRTSLYALVKSGEIRATKLGRKTLFLATDITDFLSKLQSKRESSNCTISDRRGV